MNYARGAALLAFGTITFVVSDSISFAQRGGGFRGASVGASRGAVVGPYGGAGAGSRTTGTVVGPARTGTVGAGSGSYTTGRGTTISAAGAGGKTTGPGGVTTGRGVGGVQVTTPGGQTATKVGKVGGAVGPGGTAVGSKTTIGTTTGPRGTGASIAHGGVVIGPGGVAAGGSRVGAATGPGGAVISGSRGGVVASPYGLARYSSATVVGHRTYYVPPRTLPVYGAQVRAGFVHYNAFRPAWYTLHPNAWRAAAWTTAVFWTGAAWGSLSTTCGYPAEPIVYDYGTTIVYEGDQVLYDGEPVATADLYAQQASDIAVKGQDARPTDKEEWIPLGVFGMVQGEEKDANKIFQLAINKDGIIRGNYYDALSDVTVPVYGSVDKRTQCAAWTVGEQKHTVYETGIGNLTAAETSMLVHFGKDRTQQWTLVRMDPPKEAM